MGRKRFNTQPPEGGWPQRTLVCAMPACFNTQPPEGGWAIAWISALLIIVFQHTAA